MRELFSPISFEPNKKIKIIEFFGYFCPYCRTFEPILAEWLSRQDNNIIFRHVPVDFTVSSKTPENSYFTSPYAPQKKLYFTLQAIGKLQEVNENVFREVQFHRHHLDTDESVVTFAVRQGIEKEKFLHVYNSNTIKKEVLHSAKLQRAYKVDSIPMLVINGRYIISLPISGQYQRFGKDYSLPKLVLETMENIIDKIIKNKKEI